MVGGDRMTGLEESSWEGERSRDEGGNAGRESLRGSRENLIQEKFPKLYTYMKVI